MPKIFISYAREDSREIARRLYHDLTASGYDAWIDLSEIEAGAIWSRDIEDAIESAEIVLALMSAGSYVSDICRAEQQRAIRKEKRLIPALVQADADRPIYMENRNYIDFSGDYNHALRQLFDALSGGQIPSRGGSIRKTQRTFAVAPKEKRDSRAFRRYIADLREEPWLGSRHWWAFFLFYFGDIHEIAAILKRGVILPPAHKHNHHTPRINARWDYNVRLDFRPRTPDLFLNEGIRPDGQRGAAHCPIPVYLLFDIEPVLIHPDTRFSEGDVTQVKKTYKAASAFRDMPFDLIYHDTWFRADERDEIMNARRAQVIVPKKLDLTHLSQVWCRSEAEYEMLRTLLPTATWAQWQDKITTRTDYSLFNRKWVYVSQVAMTDSAVRVRFNPCDNAPFDVRVEVESASGQKYTTTIEDFDEDDLTITLKRPLTGYHLRLFVDDTLAYAGTHAPAEVVI